MQWRQSFPCTQYVEYEVHDTTYVVEHDTIQNGFTHDFAFNNEFRTLEGNVNYKNDTVGVLKEKKHSVFENNGIW